MADRYWVGGTDTWDGTAGTKWAATSGGAGGETVPTASDDVFFDANSGAGVVTIGTSRVAKSINCTGFTGTLGNSSNAITVSGSVTLDAGMTYNHTGLMSFNGTGTLTTAGQTFSELNVNSVGVVLTLGDALDVGTRIVFVSAGTFDTASYSVSAGSLNTANTATRAIILGSSTVTLVNGGLVFNTFQTGLTLDAGTSQLVLTQSNNSIGVAGTQTSPLPWYNVSFTSTSAGARGLFGSFSFNDLSFTGPASAGLAQVEIRASQIINGTLSTTGTAGNSRVWFRSSTYGLARTLTLNGSISLTDADFRDLYIVGTAAPISGTRIGDLRGNAGITFSTPKNCFRIGTGNWSDDQWAATSGGAVNTDNFPLAQDTAVFDESTTAGTHTMNAAIPYTGTVDMSARTSALTLSRVAAQGIYGDWIFGSGITISGSQTLGFEGRKTQVITSAGKAFPGGISVNSFGGTVELADALEMGAQTITVSHGTFDTQGYSVRAAALSSSNRNVREIRLGASTVTLIAASGTNFADPLNLTFDAGTSSIVFTAGSTGLILNGGGLTFYDVSFTDPNPAISATIAGSNTFNNLSIAAPSAAGRLQYAFNDGTTITGTLTVAGASAVRRIMLRSNALGTPRTLTVGTLSADDCDFRDITIAGTAAGSSPTRAGDCGGNAGITFPAPKTVYWNLAGTQNWSATAWATTSGGSPALDNFPLAQDTAEFDEAGSAGTVQFQTFNIGTIDASARTSALTLSYNAASFLYGNYTLGSGITTTNINGHTFSGRGTQTITSAGKVLSFPVTIDCATGTVQLADALAMPSTGILRLTGGTFDTASYNVTAKFASGTFTPPNTRSLKMGASVWTCLGIGNVWFMGTASPANFVLENGTSEIIFADDTTGARTFDGSGFSFNKLTIGGATSTSTTTISGSNQFTELASTKTVAHTIAFNTRTQTFGKWSVTGTAGNVVTLTGTSTAHQLVGSCTDGIDYLAMNGVGFSASSPAEFYAGANSTGTAGAPVYRTAKPADSTRYWVGGTGFWNDTTYWSTSSGGAGGADLPRSHDDVVFDSASNATAYTATVNAISGGNRCKALTITGPASGNVTLAGSTALFIHDDITLPATGLTRTYTGAITLSGSTGGKTITTNGVTLSNNITLRNVGAGWALSDALNIGTRTLQIGGGSFDTNDFNLILGEFRGDLNDSSRTIDFGASTVTLSGNAFTLGTTINRRANLTFIAGTSQINMGSGFATFSGNDQTFHNVSFTNSAIVFASINGATTFNNLTVAGRAAAGVSSLAILNNQTINGTLTFSAGTDVTCRTFVRSNTVGTTRTLTCAAISATDVDFRDITIAGAAAPASGTRLGDCKGNSGITFVAGADKYWNLVSGGNWSATGWATSSGGAVSNDNFPLAQDTCIFEATGLNSGAAVTINAAYNIGTIDMSARTANTMTLGLATAAIYGNWINGTGTTLSGSGTLTFSGRGSQTITSAGKAFNCTVVIDSPSGTVTFQDAFATPVLAGAALELRAGTLDANGYNVTLSSGGFNSSNINARTLTMGAGTWTLGVSGNAWNVSSASLTLNAASAGTVTLTSASGKTFIGGNNVYEGITLNQGGAGTLTISGNNSFANITKTTSAATIINFASGTQRLGAFRARGRLNKILTVNGSTTNPCTLIFTGIGEATNQEVNHINLVGVRGYPLSGAWDAGAASTNGGSLGWAFTATPPDPPSATGSFLMLFI